MLGRQVPLLIVAVLTHACSLSFVNAAEPSPGAQTAINEALFQETLGDNRARSALLQEAQARAEHPAIHWAQGKILLHDRWLTPEEIGAAARQDDAAAAYVWQRASAAEDDVDAQWRLAQWCKEHNLPLQQSVHLGRVLTLAPDHPQARQEAEFVRTKAGWSRANSAAHAKRQAAIFQKWQAVFVRLGRQMLRGAEDGRAAAEKEFADITDPQAMLVAEQMYCGAHPALAALVIKQMGTIESPQLSVALARQAIYSPWQEIRDLAAERLRSRPLEEYAPLLLSSLSTPIEATIEKDADAVGRVAVQQRVYAESQYAHEVLISQVNYLGSSINRFIRAPRAVIIGVGTAPRPTLFTDVATENLARLERNDRVTRALVTATGKSLGDQPQAWWNWWAETNELYTPEKPLVYQYYCRSTYSRYIMHYQCSCFVQGTPVWTVTGMQPIEEIKPGDLVLAKDVETGELTYKPVLQTTVRPPAAIVRIEAGENLKIDATGGHRFWVSGEGWVKARELKSGSPLHTANGVVLVSDVQEQPKAPAYNLVVADYHNYFVTDAKVLCQDNLMPQPTAVKVPGLQVD